VLVQRLDNGIQYLSLDGTSDTLVTEAPALGRPFAFGDISMADDPAVFLRQWSGGFCVLDAK
jgi:hypothetical protein